jgi:hypothetical protein
MLAGLDAIGGFVSPTSESGGTSGSFAVSVTPTTLTKSRSTSSSSITLTTSAATVTVSGGAGGYTYAWTVASGDVTISANTPSAAASTFSATLSIGDEEKSAQFVCTVTDSAGAVVSSEEVSITIAAVFL